MAVSRRNSQYLAIRLIFRVAENHLAADEKFSERNIRMKKILCGCLLVLRLGALGQAHGPIPVIFDTDIAPDYDDVGALAILHALADTKEVSILATMSCNSFSTTAPTLSVINTYFHRANIPIGVNSTGFPDKECKQKWAQAIIQKYPHSIHSNAEAMDAVLLYRKILSAQPDHSVTIISTGFFSNLAHLLTSTADAYSPLSGKNLVARKVRQLVSMATRLDKDSTEGYEFNVVVDASSSKLVFEQWPTPVILSGFEVGADIHTGIRLIQNQEIRNSPVQDAFRIALTSDRNTQGRSSWDETAVLAAVRGFAPWFDTLRLNFRIEADGRNVVIPGRKFTCLRLRLAPDQVAHDLEELMMQQPKSRGLR
jgi:inosine-uridine nucleoside N-ribohydrolase